MKKKQCEYDAVLNRINEIRVKLKGVSQTELDMCPSYGEFKYLDALVANQLTPNGDYWSLGTYFEEASRELWKELACRHSPNSQAHHRNNNNDNNDENVTDLILEDTGVRRYVGQLAGDIRYDYDNH